MDHSPRYSATALGGYIRQLRKRRGIKGRQLAATAKVDASWLSRVERGVYQKPSMQSLERVATALGISVADIYAAAGYKGARDLPGFAPYLRAKFDLPDEAIIQLEQHFELINERYVRQKGAAAHDPDHPSPA